MSDNDNLELTRRTFLLTTGSTAAATMLAACVPPLASSDTGQSGEAVSGADRSDISGAVPLTLRVNGKEHKLRIDPRTTLPALTRRTRQAFRPWRIKKPVDYT